MGRWRRHIYRGVAETLQRDYDLEPGAVLETAWEELDPRVQHDLLWGTGDAAHHLHVAQRPVGPQMGRHVRRHHPQAALAVPQHEKPACSGGSWKSTCAWSPAASASGQRLNPQACAVTLTTRSPAFADGPSRIAARGVRAGRSPTPGSSSPSWSWTRPARRSPPRTWSRRSAAGWRSSSDVGLDYLTLDRTAPTLVRRRNAANPPGRPDRLRPGRRAVHPRRAVDRPAPARQRPAAGHARPAARPGQHGRRRRARRGHDVGGRSHRRFRPRPGRPRRAGRRHRPGRADHRRAGEPHRRSFSPAGGEIAVPERRRPIGERKLDRPRRDAQQPQERRRRDPARRVRLRHRRLRLGQELAGQRHPRRGAAPRSQRRRWASPAPTSGSTASNISTR